MHLLKGLMPTGSGFGCRANNQLSVLNLQIDVSVQMTLLDDRFRNPDALGVADSHDTSFHGDVLRCLAELWCNYIGATSSVKDSPPPYSLTPSVGSTFIHMSPPQRAIPAATSNDAVHPQ